jgi:hypothetical protein
MTPRNSRLLVDRRRPHPPGAGQRFERERLRPRPPLSEAASSSAVPGSGYDAPARRLTISQQVVPTRGGLTITPCKTAGSHRALTLDEETVEWLERHREKQIAEKGAGRPRVRGQRPALCRRARSTARPAADHRSLREASQGGRGSTWPATRPPALARHAPAQPWRAGARRRRSTRARVADHDDEGVRTRPAYERRPSRREGGRATRALAIGLQNQL